MGLPCLMPTGSIDDVSDFVQSGPRFRMIPLFRPCPPPIPIILERRDVLVSNVLVALGKKVEKDELLQITENINK